MNKFHSKLNELKSDDNYNSFKSILDEYKKEIDRIMQGGGLIAIEKQHSKGRLTARERINHLIDQDSSFFELGLFAAYGMYEEYGSPAASGTIIGTGKINNQECMIVANDATVKAGAYLKLLLKKHYAHKQLLLKIIFLLYI